MEQLKHECGVAMIRLLKPIDYYRRKYGTEQWAFNKLYLLMEKQHNRGQEGAGIGVVKMNTPPGTEYVFRERALGAGAITEIFDSARRQIAEAPSIEEAPFIGNIYMGHLRYSTTGKSGISYVHPFLRRNNWKSRNLLLCGNFNLTNVDRVFDSIVATGQHPRFYGDTVVLLEQLGYSLDQENQRLFRLLRDQMEEPALSRAIEDGLDIGRILRGAAPSWDGGFVICGATGSGDMFAVRDSKGIRPAFYFANDEVVVLASERPVIQTVFNVPIQDVTELEPGCALIVTNDLKMSVERILPEAKPEKCSFERIYFSRGSDADIYRERKALGFNLSDAIMHAVDHDFDHTVFSFIPNTAEVAFIGMVEGMEKALTDDKTARILELQAENRLTPESLTGIMNRRLRVDKVAIKDIKLRTFIAEGAGRDELAAHVYDVTYGCVEKGIDNLVVIDDSIVRGTTLRQSILTMLSRLHPRKIVIVSSSPQVRYPDCYGIDMSRMTDFIAFKAAVELLRERGMENILAETYRLCVERPEEQNWVKRVYEPFTNEEIAAKIAQILSPEQIECPVEIIFQTLEGLHKAVPEHSGDWYFSGNYPTIGGVRLVNNAFAAWYQESPRF
ncbi:MAG: amidophosphoribosyltransferase [Muribaculaceae bacterium]|nr:amidophosphoribosyltransferase [Muribaculaceae bacterium]